MSQSVSPIPEGFHSITPHLVCENAVEALAFYERAFGAKEVARMAGPDGKIMHAELRIGDSMVMLAEAFPEYGSRDPRALRGTPVTIHMYVEDADAVWERALAAGATAQMPIADAFWGDRYGQVVDPFGHQWSIATHQRELTPQQIEEAMRKEMPGSFQG
jgi:uncharacterized glyoxalase superfamily protein PhnB